VSGNVQGSSAYRIDNKFGETRMNIREQLHVVQEDLERTVLAGKEREREYARALKAEQAAYQQLAGKEATRQKQLEVLKTTVQAQQEKLERYDLESQQHAQEKGLLQRRLTKLRDIIEQQERKLNTQNANLTDSHNQLLDLKEKQQSREREHALALYAVNQKLAVARLGSKTQASRSLTHNMQLVSESGLFDCAWYLATYQDVAESGVDPVKHYLSEGAGEGRNPGPDFDTVGYVTMYADVIESGLNPLVHYIRFGRSEQRLPKPGNRLLPSSERHAQGSD
jgi:hypothetical protein